MQLMTKKDRQVPDWAKVREDGITPAGLGEVDGNQPCFCTARNNCCIYLPHSLVSKTQRKTAISIFGQILPVIDGIWPDCGDRQTTVKVNGDTWRIRLDFHFSHIIIRRL